MRVITPLDITSDTAFSRASTATYYDSTGTLQTAAIDVVRVNYDPETLEPEGILIEDAATNNILYSEDFSNAVWTKGSSSITANAITAPNGTLTADKVVENSLTNTHNVTQVGATAVIGQDYKRHVFVKAAERSYVFVGINNAVTAFLSVNLATGESFAAVGSFVSSEVISLPGGWYKITIEATATTATGIQFDVRVSYDGVWANRSYLGDGVSGIYVWGAHDNEGSYIPTVATAVTRAADMLGDMVTSTVAEPDAGESAWNAATNYALNDIVIRTTTHKKYINIQAGVDATFPEVDAALDEPTRWIETGSTNRYAMFDTLRNTQTETTSPLSIVLVPGTRVNSIGMLAMEAEEITIKVANGYEQIYSYTQNLNSREVLDWYDFFFEPFSNTPNVVKFDLPPYTAGNITVTLTSSTGTVKCGAVIMGNYTDIGDLVYGARISANNFSRIDREFDGTAVLVQRQTKPKLSGTTFFNKSQTNKILALKATLNAKPTVWSGLNADNTDGYFDGLVILGIYKIFDVDIAYPEKAKLDIELEEI
jgi:hypothetical protein